MHYAFQDRENLYLVIDIMPGGDLRYHFAKHRKFSEEQTSINILCLTTIIRVLYGLHASMLGVSSWEEHFAQRYQT
jgi:serine/threonine protein kinase